MPPTCEVLRCQEPVTDMHVMDDWGRRVELGICAAHAAEINAGEEWLFDSDQHVLFMGADLVGTGDVIVNGMRVRWGSGVTGRRGEAALHVELTGRRRGTDEKEVVEFVLANPNIARGLARNFQRFADRADQAPE